MSSSRPTVAGVLQLEGSTGLFGLIDLAVCSSIATGALLDWVKFFRMILLSIYWYTWCMVLAWDLFTDFCCAFTGAWCLLEAFPLILAMLLLVHGFGLWIGLTIQSLQPACLHIQLSFTLIWTIAGLETNYSQSKQTRVALVWMIQRGEYLKSRKSQHFHSTLLLSCYFFISTNWAGALQLKGSAGLLDLSSPLCVLFNCYYCTLGWIEASAL